MSVVASNWRQLQLAESSVQPNSKQVKECWKQLQLVGISWKNLQMLPAVCLVRKKEKAGTMLAYVACCGSLGIINERGVLCMAACKCEHTLRKGGSLWHLLFIAWSPLKYKEVLNCLEVQLVPFKMENGMRACTWTVEGCSSLPLAHLIDGTCCWENAEGHSVFVLPVVANGTVVLPIGEMAGQVNLGRALPFVALSLSLANTEQNVSLHSFYRTENSSFPLPSLPSDNPSRDLWETCVIDPVSSWASPPSPLPLIAWCSSKRGLSETLGAFETVYYCSTRWLLWLWISYYSWWLPSPRRLWIYWLVRGFGDCVRPQSRWYL